MTCWSSSLDGLVTLSSYAPLIQILHGNTPARELFTDDLKDGRQPIFVVRLELDRPGVSVEFHRAVRALEVVARGDFFTRLIHCIVDLLEIDTR